MKFHIVIDNNPNPNNNLLLNEHGLSVFFSSNNCNILVDTGASDKFISNMQQLQLPDIKEIDNVIVSHGHNDHTGGLKSFFENNTKATATIHNSVKGEKFFSCRPKSSVTGEYSIKEFRSIGMQQSLFIEFGHRFNHIEKATNINADVTVIPVYSEKNTYPQPMGNSFLYKNDFPDDFSHETAVLVHTDNKFCVVSPCSHNGILNILESCANHIAQLKNTTLENSRKQICTFIGGLHYVDYLPATENIANTFSILTQLYPQLNVYSGHCTCSNASGQIKLLLGSKYQEFYTGSIIEI